MENSECYLIPMIVKILRGRSRQRLRQHGNQPTWNSNNTELRQRRTAQASQKLNKQHCKEFVVCVYHWSVLGRMHKNDFRLSGNLNLRLPVEVDVVQCITLEL